MNESKDRCKSPLNKSDIKNSSKHRTKSDTCRIQPNTDNEIFHRDSSLPPAKESISAKSLWSDTDTDTNKKNKKKKK